MCSWTTLFQQHTRNPIKYECHRYHNGILDVFETNVKVVEKNRKHGNKGLLKSRTTTYV